MKCKICQKEIAENETLCESCKAAQVSRPKKVFKVTIPSEAIEPMKTEETFDLQESKEEPAFEKEEVFEKETVEAEAVAEPEADFQEETEIEKEEKDSAALIEELLAFSKSIAIEQEEKRESIEDEAPVKCEDSAKEAEKKKQAAKERAAKIKAQQAAQKEKTASLWMRVISCVCVAFCVILIAVNATTDIFSQTQTDKTVAFSGLTDGEKTAFEQYAVKYFALFEKGYDSATACETEIIELMKPYSQDGLYSGVYSKAQTVTDQADPVSRFSNDDYNSYSYCVVDAKEIESIFESLNLTALNDANHVDYYYHDGKYYFKDKSLSEDENGSVELKVTSSKKTSDGNYYIACNYYDKDKINSQGEVSQSDMEEIYFIVELEKNETQLSWKILKISNEALYNSTGSKIDTAKDGSLSYTLERKVISATTSDGKEYANYVVIYPVFETQGATETAISTTYSEMIEDFEAKAKKADKLYSSYIEKGGSDDALPFYNHVTVSVTYNENGYFSTIQRKAVYSASTNEEDAKNPYTVKFPEISFEGFTFEIDGGDFVKKDDVLSKDYLAVQNELFKIQGGYGADEEVSDTNSIGQSIYSSAWTLGEDGVIFYYQNEWGALQRVTLPYESLLGSVKYQEKIAVKEE